MTAGRKVISDNKDWCTPPKYVEAVSQVFKGHIHLDPCSNSYSVVHAEVEYLPGVQDGLTESWDYPTIYVNPPYGRDQERGSSIADWLKRCADAHRRYNSEVLALVPVATNTGHWKKYVFGNATGICFLYDTRLRFLVNGRDTGKGAPMSCAMIYWGQDFDHFYRFFAPFGAALNIEELRDAPIGAHKSKRGQPRQMELSLYYHRMRDGTC